MATVQEKNKAYRRIKELQGFVRERLLHKNEMWKVTDDNVRRNTQSQKLILKPSLEMKKLAKIVDPANPKLSNVEYLRPGGDSSKL